MSGWRDTEGRTTGQRRKQRAAQDTARFVADAKRRPFSNLIKPALGLAFVAVLVLALLQFVLR